MKITLLSFYNRFEEYSTKYSLGTMKIAAYLKRNQKLDVSVVPINLDAPFPDDLIKEITSNSATDILGIPNYIWTRDIAQKADPFVDKKFMTYLMKIRLLQGLYFFAEEKNKYTQNNMQISNEILKKYYSASKKIAIFEKMNNSNDNSLSASVTNKVKISRDR